MKSLLCYQVFALYLRTQFDKQRSLADIIPTLRIELDDLNSPYMIDLVDENNLTNQALLKQIRESGGGFTKHVLSQVMTRSKLLLPIFPLPNPFKNSNCGILSWLLGKSLPRMLGKVTL